MGGRHDSVADGAEAASRTSRKQVLVVTTRMSELHSSSTVSSSSSEGLLARNWKGVLAPRISPL